jgi:hypothetical protein
MSPRSAKQVLKRILGAVIVLLMVAALGFFIALPSALNWSESRRFSGALAGARSVAITEFVPVIDFSANDPPETEIPLQRIAATSEQIRSLRSAVSGFLEAGVLRAHKRCFTPHHRVEIIGADGSSFRADVCLQCDGILFSPGGIMATPSPWLQPLRDFFTAMGMPPRSPDEYKRLAHLPRPGMIDR